MSVLEMTTLRFLQFDSLQVRISAGFVFFSKEESLTHIQCGDIIVASLTSNIKRLDPVVIWCCTN